MFRKGILVIFMTILLLSTTVLAFSEQVSASETTLNSTNNYGFEFPDPIGPKPLLTVLLEFSDQKAIYEPSLIREQMFGPRPSMNDYFNETSYDNFYFIDKGVWKWIEAWDDPTTTEDESTQKYWDSLYDYGGGKFRWWGLKSLYESENFNFSKFDTNGNKVIGLGWELSYIVIESRTITGGSNRPLLHNAEGKIDWHVTQDDLKLGDVNFTGSGAGVSGGEIGGENPFLVIAHELAHNALGLPDYYSGNVKPENIIMYSLMGDYYGPHHLDAYSKYKLGWLKPTIVMNDGFYTISDSETNPSAFILHDPAHGTDEYFLVENRWMGNSYDNTAQFLNNDQKNIKDEGLIIWHVDENRDWNGSKTGSIAKVQLLTCDGRFGSIDNYLFSAFNGSDENYYNFNDFSQPRNSRWWSGQRSGIGIYELTNAGSYMTAYFDIPGSVGILSWLDEEDLHLDPSGSTIFKLNIFNTGSISDTVNVKVQNLDSSLTSSVTSAGYILIGGEVRVLNIVITGIDPSCHTPINLFNFKIITESVNNRIFKQVHFVSLNTSFVDQRVQITSGPIEVEPGYWAGFTMSFQNGGNVKGYINFDFQAIADNAAKAYPKEIHVSWVNSLAEKSGIMSKCFGTLSTEYFYIAIPSDWAGLSDTIYKFNIITTSEYGYEVVVESSIKVIATPESMLRYNIQQIKELADQTEYKSMKAKVQNAVQKSEFALIFYQLGNLLLAKNSLTVSQNEVLAYKNEVQAQSGKLFTFKQAAELFYQAEKLINDMEASKTELYSNVIIDDPGSPPIEK